MLALSEPRQQALSISYLVQYAKTALITQLPELDAVFGPDVGLLHYLKIYYDRQTS
jgi:hypothetical protein